MRWHFFFLGAGFMLLEAQIISNMALLFGTTWVVNSIVISGLLLLIVGANLLAERKPAFPITLAYVGILASMLVAYLIAVERFLFASVWLKALSGHCGAVSAGVFCGDRVHPEFRPARNSAGPRSVRICWEHWSAACSSHCRCGPAFGRC